MSDTITAVRAALLHFTADPASAGDQAYQYYPDGLLIIKNGYIDNAGPAEQMLPLLPESVSINHYPNCLITPGFIDTHIHYPQTGMIASYGEQLLDWLEKYTFPAEKAFADPSHAEEVAEVFLNELLRNGTTTALVFGTVHPESVDAFFSQAQRRCLRMIAGKVMMDRQAPEYLLDTPESSYQQSKTLIERWHQQDRLLYAVTPRFAITSSKEQLAKAGQLLQEFPDVYLHTHLSENTDEIELIKQLFPDAKDYLDVYDTHQLLGSRSVFAHGVHLCDHQCQRLAETGSALSFCPSSNLFLGSGLFDLAKMEKYGVKVGMGTDVGGGTSFSLLQTLGDGYKVNQLKGQQLSPLKSFYLATLGGAKALNLDSKIGNFTKGKEADFVVLDYQATPLIKYRLQHTTDIAEKLFVLTTLGDDRAVAATYIMGQLAYQR
ncbi:guanine deaminase [Endozoicomonas sp. SM1973]|uniref:Guanine deaminase n=1 Tax=Spartinivicinus marinus TaxID=2994442 RepID=A0A853I885_9GAMM|nr:guanine deaminase [Spartinivicinus marinus]MCX4027177.1 guanine deaminase [Spartinivicinus marinus]NYZ66101.1 guanine deaminase [Spartinivicinus marinus]